MKRKEARALDLAVAELDRLMRRYQAMEWQLTRSTFDNHGESLKLEMSTTAGDHRKWLRVGWLHKFRGGRLHEPEPLLLSELVDREHEQIDADIARARLEANSVTS